jgi:hypothetical protein
MPVRRCLALHVSHMANAPAGFCALDFPLFGLAAKTARTNAVRTRSARSSALLRNDAYIIRASKRDGVSRRDIFGEDKCGGEQGGQKHAAHRLLLFRRRPPKRLCVQEDLAPNFEVERQKVICVLRREGSRRGGRRLGLRGGQPNYLTSPRCIHSPSANMVLVNRDM